jgi:hypothetical protein
MHAAPDAGDIGGRNALRGWRRIVPLTLAVAAALGAVAASAQEPSPTNGNYGGGAIPDPPKSAYGPGSMVISLRSTGNGTVQVVLGMGARCGTPTVKTHAALLPDGSFTASGTASERVFGHRRLTAKYTFAGRIEGASATGTASMSSTDKTRRRRARHCKTGTVSWGASRPSGDIGVAGSAQPTARLYGTTSQRFAGRSHAIALRISADGHRLTRALYSLNYSCGRFGGYEVDTPNRNVPIGATGKVSDVERYSVNLGRGSRGRFTERFSGTIGSTGATGTFKLTGRLYVARTGRTYAHCRSGKVKWSAAL